MSDELTRLRALLAAATPGPWTVEEETEVGDGLRMLTIPQIERTLHDDEWADAKDWKRDQRNAVLIVAAINAMPALLDRVERAEAPDLGPRCCDDCRRSHPHGCLLPLQAERDALAAQVAMLREALAPFAAAADVVERSAKRLSDDVGLWIHSNNVTGDVSITLGDVRRARAALTTLTHRAEDNEGCAISWQER